MTEYKRFLLTNVVSSFLKLDTQSYHFIFKFEFNANEIIHYSFTNYRLLIISATVIRSFTANC
jgi:hypothetical protein